MALALAAVLALLLAGCAGGTASLGGGAPAASRSVSATDAIAGTWIAVDAAPLVQLTFAKDGTVRQRLTRDGALLEMGGTWEVQGPGRIVTRERRAGVPNAHAVYAFRVDGRQLTLTWVEQDGLPASSGDTSLSWLAGTNHPTITFRR
jgi:hypothetical protein